MRLDELCPLLAACLLGSITGVTSATVPDGRSGFFLAKRQDLSTDGTEKLRDCKPPLGVYEGQDTASWYEVNDENTELEVTTTSKKGEGPTAPKDEKQGKRFVTDHVLELQLLQAAFDDKNKEYNDDAKKITDDVWKVAKEAVAGDNRENCKKIAEKITVLDNLRGIAEQINLGKKTVYTKVVDVSTPLNSGIPHRTDRLQGRTDTDMPKKKGKGWEEYLKAWDKYLAEYESKVETVADNTAGAMSEFTGKDAVGNYVAKFLKDKYKEGQDYVKWQLSKQDGDGDGDGDGEEQPTESPAVEATPKCDDTVVVHSVDDLNPIIDTLKEQGNGANNDNCCTSDVVQCTQLEFNGAIGLDMCGPVAGPAQCTGCAKVANALTSLMDTCAQDGRVGGEVQLLDGVTLELRQM
ncbi:MAG: hypothetical protein Q9221_008188 [Calogaya cf. arnoldii]